MSLTSTDSSVDARIFDHGSKRGTLNSISCEFHTIKFRCKINPSLWYSLVPCLIPKIVESSYQFSLKFQSSVAMLVIAFPEQRALGPSCFPFSNRLCIQRDVLVGYHTFYPNQCLSLTSVNFVIMKSLLFSSVQFI